MVKSSFELGFAIRHLVARPLALIGSILLSTIPGNDFPDRW